MNPPPQRTRPEAREVTILLVEDDTEEVELARAALELDSARVRVLVAHDGVEALGVLNRETENQRPSLILLDLNMPRMDGRETLRRLKADPALCGIPVVVLTTSTSPADVRECYDLQASAFVTKPMGLARFREAVRSVRDFFMQTAELPLLM